MKSALGDMGQEIWSVIRQAVANSWLVRMSLAITPVLLACSLVLQVLSHVERFGPHGACLLWLPSLLTLFVVADALIGLAYVVISLILIYFVCKTRHVIPFQSVYISFGIFIFACGMTHFFDIWTLWIPDYWAQGIVKSLTAVASVATAISLPTLVPKVITLVQTATISDERGQQIAATRQVLSAETDTSHVDVVALAQEVAASKKAVEQALAVRDQFMANVSHELRTPLAAIQGYSELIRDHDLPSEQVHEFAQTIFESSERLKRMINDLLDLERMKSGKMELSRTQVDINALIISVLSQLRPIAEGRIMTLQLDDAAPTLLADYDKLTQVITNLLSNAMKYSNGEEIIVGTNMEDDHIRAWVQDHGVGIAPESLEQIFVPYARIQSGGTPGTGLGLPIARQIIQLHGGDIQVKSTLGEGSTFSFTLPLRDAHE
jgi:signal transduction histidine kinase